MEANATGEQPAAESYRVEYATEGGPVLASGIHETATSLRVDLAAGTAFLERRQPTSTEGGEPVGTFAAPLAAEARQRLRQIFDRLDLGSIPPGTAGGPGVSLIRLRVTRGQPLEATFSSRDIPTLERLEDVLSTLEDVAAATAEHPLQAIQAEVHPVGAPATAFDVILKNVGKEPLVLVPPPRGGGAGGFPAELDWAGVRFALYPPEKPGITAPPLEWKEVSAHAPAATDPEGVVIVPGAALSLRTNPWKPLARRERHLIQALFSSYTGGPVRDGRVVFRGRALSSALELVPNGN